MFRTCTVRAVRTLADGCRLLVFDWPEWLPRAEGDCRIPGIVIDPEVSDGPVHVGSRVESDVRDDGEPFDGESTLAYSIDGGPWIESRDVSRYGHEYHRDIAPLLRDVLSSEAVRQP